MISDHKLVLRDNCAAVAIRPTKFLVFGGSKKGNDIKNGYIFDVVTLKISKILGKKNDFRFES